MFSKKVVSAQHCWSNCVLYFASLGGCDVVRLAALLNAVFDETKKLSF